MSLKKKKSQSISIAEDNIAQIGLRITPEARKHLEDLLKELKKKKKNKKIKKKRKIIKKDKKCRGRTT